MVAGSSVTITCEVDAVPEPTITWLLNENELLNNVNKTSLTVDNPSRVNLQTVSCTAANILGSDSRSSYFTILGKKCFFFYRKLNLCHNPSSITLNSSTCGYSNSGVKTKCIDEILIFFL